MFCILLVGSIASTYFFMINPITHWTAVVWPDDHLEPSDQKVFPPQDPLDQKSFTEKESCIEYVREAAKVLDSYYYECQAIRKSGSKAYFIFRP